MRRSVGVLIMLATLLPFYNVGLPALAIPFSRGMTAYASGIGDTCADSLARPPLLGLYGSCSGSVARGRVTAPSDPDGRYRNLDHAYDAVGRSASIDGPSYGAGRDWRAGKQLAVGSHPTDAVITLGLLFERRAWPRRTRTAASAEALAEESLSQGEPPPSRTGLVG